MGIAGLVFSSCHDTIDPPLKPEYYQGTYSLEFNGESSELCVYARYVKIKGKKTIAIIGDYYEGILLRRTFNLVLPDSMGQFPIHNEVNYDLKFAGATYYYVDVDVGLADYNIPVDKPNGSVEITSYDRTLKKIEGRADCVLYLTTNHGLSNPPDSLVIKNAVFSTYMTE